MPYDKPSSARRAPSGLMSQPFDTSELSAIPFSSAVALDIETLQLTADFLFETRRLIEAGVELLSESGDFVGDGLVASIISFGSADVAAGREDVLMRADLLQGRGVAEAGDVLVFLGGDPRGLGAAPGMVGAAYPLELVIGEDPLGAIRQDAGGAGFDEEHLAAPVG